MELKSNNDRRYFVVEGPGAQMLINSALDERRRFLDAVAVIEEKYGACGYLTKKGCMVTGLVFDTDEPRPGLKIKGTQDGKYWAYPDKRTKVGRELVKEMQRASSPKHYSDMILDHYDAHRMMTIEHPMSPSGMAMAMSVASVTKCLTKILLSIPNEDKAPFNPPAEAREIKKSEYIALTEEQ